MTGLLDFVATQEGFSPKPYWDFKQWTSGYGTRASGPGEVIDQTEAQRRLQAEIDKARGYVMQRWGGLAPNQADALASFTYNLGPGWMQGSNLSKAVDAQDWDSAASIMQQYVNAGGKPLPGLLKRRQAEASMLMGGDLGVSGGAPAAGQGFAGGGFLGGPPAAMEQGQGYLPAPMFRPPEIKLAPIVPSPYGGYV